MSLKCLLTVLGSLLASHEQISMIQILVSTCSVTIFFNAPFPSGEQKILIPTSPKNAHCAPVARSPSVGARDSSWNGVQGNGNSSEIGRVAQKYAVFWLLRNLRFSALATHPF
jgi:hypothetical protein